MMEKAVTALTMISASMTILKSTYTLGHCLFSSPEDWRAFSRAVDMGPAVLEGFSF